MIRTHVMSNGRDWIVRVLGATIHDTLSSVDAERVARDYLTRRGGGELVVHGADGRVRRIRVPADPGRDQPTTSR